MARNQSQQQAFQLTGMQSVIQRLQCQLELMPALSLVSCKEKSMDDNVSRVWTMMAKLDYCMLVTKGAKGLSARPMSSIVKANEGKVYFLADAQGAKDDEIVAQPDALLAYSNGSSQFISTRAKAEISNDRALIKRLWNPGAQAFWRKGPDDLNVIAIVTTPESAELWDSSGGVVGSVKMAIALLTGSVPSLGENSKVRL
jgi:general stress protein 26